MWSVAAVVREKNVLQNQQGAARQTSGRYAVIPDRTLREELFGTTPHPRAPFAGATSIVVVAIDRPARRPTTQDGPPLDAETPPSHMADDPSCPTEGAGRAS